MGALERWSIGEVTVTKLHEVTMPAPANGMLPEATPDALAAHAWWSQPHFVSEAGELQISIHALVIETPSQRIVVDTCVGNSGKAPFPGFDQIRTDFLDRFTAAFDPASIDVVVCTHLHFDHVGWNTHVVDGRVVPTFPNARYLFGRVEHAHWAASGDDPYAAVATAFWADCVGAIEQAGLMQLVESDHRLCAEVRLVPTPGHSPGHHSVVIESAGQSAVITGDCLHSPLQFAFPEWQSVADGDQATAGATRERVRREWAASSALVIGTHFASPTAGRVRNDERGWWFDTTPM